MGLLLGTAGGGLCDVDLDAMEALFAADAFLPATAMVSGRPSKPRSHRWYVIEGRLMTVQFEDPVVKGKVGETSKAMLLELRANAKNGRSVQTVVPPSVHPSGERVAWVNGLEPARVEAEDLVTAVKYVAATALIARHWPDHGEHGHEFVLCLSGALLRSGLKIDLVKKIVMTAAHIAGYTRADEADVDDTLRNLSANRPATGWPRLGDILGGKVAKQLGEWLGKGNGCPTSNGKSGQPTSGSEEKCWQENLIRNDQGAPRALLANAISALRQAPCWKGVLSYNLSSLFVVTQRPCPFPREVGSIWTDVDDVLCADWLQHQGINVSHQVAAAAVQAVARDHTFHPIRDYLNGLIWDKNPRLARWLIDCLGTVDTAYVRAVAQCWLISAVARVFQPGCQVDHVLMLEGLQGTKKSTALRILASDPWFTDHVSDLQNKDARLELRGRLIVELAEMDRLRREESERVKSFLTTRIDSFRPPYGRRVEVFPRECVFAATTNEQTPLVDATGNRRFWPVRCGEINVERIAKERDQLWAEAVSLFRSGAKWWLESQDLITAASDEQEARYDTGVWDEMIAEWVESPRERVDRDSVPLGPLSSTRDQVTISDILIHAIGKPVERLNQADQNAVARCLTSRGWSRRYLGPKGQRRYFYVRPKSKTQ
jgi:predicted P-loop ATPase